MNKTIEFIIPTFDRKKELIAMLSSLNAQTENNWKATVISDGEKNQDTAKIVESFNNPRIIHKGLDKRYNDWGHTPREVGKQLSGSDYLIMTGDDNYYIPTLIHEINTVINKDNPDFIYWDMVHSHYDYSYFKTSPALNHIDMGAFAFKSELGKQVSLGTTYAADGLFVRDFLSKFKECKIVKIDKILFVHN